MSRARKARILERVEPVSETAVASEIADAIHRLADACYGMKDELSGIAGALSYLAAAKHSGTAGEQRQLGAVIYQTSVKRFGGLKYDGEPIDQMTIESLDKAFRKMLRKP